jgi:hypothetical protein
MDGATAWVRTRRITLPLLTPVIFFNVTMAVIGSFQAFTQAYIVTQGGPEDSTLFIALYLWNRAWKYLDLGYASAATFLGDDRTYAIVVMVPTWDTELKIVRHADAFSAFCRATPALAPLVEDRFAEALTDVLPMGALHTVWHGFDEAPVRRFVALGDSFCHTDPSFALGISNALVQGAALADVAATHDDGDVPRAFYARVRDELRERFEFARDVSAARADRMKGLPVAISRNGCYPLYALMASLGCAPFDAQVHRMAYRRHGFLDRLARFDGDDAMQRRVEELFPGVVERMRAAPPLPRARLLELLSQAA